jgi:23S rRNA maturation-related 3'-5' exoribonuclease YhaM
MFVENIQDVEQKLNPFIDFLTENKISSHLILKNGICDDYYLRRKMKLKMCEVMKYIDYLDLDGQNKFYPPQIDCLG